MFPGDTSDTCFTENVLVVFWWQSMYFFIPNCTDVYIFSLVGIQFSDAALASMDEE